MSSWIAAGTSYSTHNQPMLPFYIFYSMFGFQRIGDLAWPPATARARLPDRRHRRSHHAERRRPAARGRPQPPAGLDHPELPHLRSDLRLRTGGDHPRRLAADDRRAAGHLLLHHRDERELRPAGHAEGRRGRHHQGHVPPRGGQEGSRSPRATAGLRHHPARSRGSGQAAAQRLRHRRRRLERAELQRAASRRPRRRALEPPASGPEAEAELRRGVPGRPSRPGDRLHRLHEALRRADPPVGSLQSTRCSAPTASAAATAARSCATSSKWIVTGWCWPRSKRWPIAAISSQKWWPRPSPSTVSIRRSATRWIANSLHTPSAARGFAPAPPTGGATNQGPKVFVLRAQRWWHVKGEECERTHSRTRHRQR